MHQYSENVVFTPERLREEVNYFLDQDAFAFDVETMGAYRNIPTQNRVVWIALATRGRAIVIPMGHPNGNVLLERARKKKNRETGKFDNFPAKWDDPPQQMRPSEVFEILKPLFFHPLIKKIAHNATFDLISVAKYYNQTVPCPPYRDTIVEDWLRNENHLLKGLKDVTKRRYQRTYDNENVGKRGIELFSFNKVAQYAYLDVKYTWLEYLENIGEIKRDNLTQVNNLEMDVLEVLLDMGMEGTPVDIERMKELAISLSARKTQAEGEVYKAAGYVFNLNSNPQKVKAFYGPKSEGGQGLKPWRLTDGGRKKKKAGIEVTINDYSTDAEALERWPENKLVKAFMDYQEVDRVLGTYIIGYLGKEFCPPSLVVGKVAEKIEPTQIFDGKVFPDFVQYGTITGRFSCRAPNLQNIPRPDTELGKEIRGLFVAGPGHKLIVADYGQVELVVLAHFVGKGALYDGFYKGIDPHTMTAAMVFDYDPVEMTHLIKVVGDAEAKGYRQIAKNLNFAIVYGAGPEKVAAMSKSTKRNAEKWLAIHEKQFPEIYAFKDQAIRVMKTRKPPHLTTLVGRKRRIPAIMSREWGIQGRAERQAINSLIQGSAADLIKTAMREVNNGLREQGTGRLLLTVHDELVCRAPEQDAEAVAAVLREGMTGAVVQSMVDVPLAIDLNIVDRWAEAK